jgi:hypothetical protein
MSPPNRPRDEIERCFDRWRVKRLSPPIARCLRDSLAMAKDAVKQLGLVSWYLLFSREYSQAVAERAHCPEREGHKIKHAGGK